MIKKLLAPLPLLIDLKSKKRQGDNSITKCSPSTVLLWKPRIWRFRFSREQRVVHMFVISISNLNVSGIQKRRPIILLSHYQANTNSVHGVYACNPLTVLVGEFACDVDVHRFGNSFACPSDNRITIVHRAMLHKGIEMAGAVSLSLSLVTKYLTCGSTRGRTIDFRAAFPNPSLLFFVPSIGN